MHHRILRDDACRSRRGIQILREFLENKVDVTADRLANLCIIDKWRSVDPYHRGEGILIAALLARFKFRSASESCRLSVEAPFIMTKEGDRSLARFMKQHIYPVTVTVLSRIEGRDSAPSIPKQGDPAHGDYPL